MEAPEGAVHEQTGVRGAGGGVVPWLWELQGRVGAGLAWLGFSNNLFSPHVCD